MVGADDTNTVGPPTPEVSDRTRPAADASPNEAGSVSVTADEGPRLDEAAGVQYEAASRALVSLRANEVVRLRSELQAATVGWQLDHAYLALPILRIEREHDHWHRLLVERAQAYAEASWHDKWNALLPLGVQVRLVGARLQRRFRYGAQRRYALKSLSRVIPAIAVFGLIVGLVWATQ